MINLFQNAMTTFSTKNTSSTGRGIFQYYLYFKKVPRSSTPLKVLSLIGHSWSLTSLIFEAPNMYFMPQKTKFLVSKIGLTTHEDQPVSVLIE